MRGASDNPKHAKYKQYNWKVVQELKTPGAGNLFVKTHPKSKHLWTDMPMNPERENAETNLVFDLTDLSKPPVKIDVAKDSGPSCTRSATPADASRTSRPTSVLTART